MEWFLEIFDDTSDRARFFAILISSIVAVSVVLLNKHLERKAARRDLFIEKLEDIAIEVRSLNDLLETLISHDVMVASPQVVKIISSIDRIQVLRLLYFPNLKNPILNCEENFLDLRKACTKDIPLNLALLDSDDTIEKIKISFAYFLFDVIEHMHEIRH